MADSCKNCIWVGCREYGWDMPACSKHIPELTMQMIKHLVPSTVDQHSSGVKVEGHVGTWYVIDSKEMTKYGDLFLLEHETYGDEAACLIVDRFGKVILMDVFNGFDELDEAFE